MKYYDIFVGKLSSSCWHNKELQIKDEGIGKNGLLSCITTAEITTRLQNKYHLESSENWAICESGNQGIKVVTFIQMGRKGRDTEMRGEAWRPGDAG